MKWPAGVRESNPSSGCHGSRCIVALEDAKTTAHLYLIGFSVGVNGFPFGSYRVHFSYFGTALVFIYKTQISSSQIQTAEDNQQVLLLFLKG